MTYENKISAIDELKQQLDKHRPFDRHTLGQLKEYYRIGLTYSSNALEGNSLTETETKIVLEDGITIGGKPIRDHYEALGHSEAYDLLYRLSTANDITEKDILELHRLFYYRIDEAKAGHYRKGKVIITGTDFIPPPPSEISALMKKFVADTPKMREKYHSVEFAALLHKELVTIHPFVDGNGRAARLLMNLALLQSGYVITIIPPILRNEYINAIKKTQIAPQTDAPFINFISAMVYESIKDYLRLLNAL
ncbi:MAG: Fic family protein [Planctomycetes bacterium]|nr:Fic family protein [Planctomycetota bacterium]